MSKTILLNNYSTQNECKHEIEYISPNLYDELIKNKNKIDTLDNTKIWDNAKKLSNEYELIHLPNKKNKCDSIAIYDPLSRSYFKMCEIITDFNLFTTSKPINILCLAEGPGGFIEALNNYRKKQNILDTIYGITLKSTNKDIPGWKKTKLFLGNNTNINILYGKDGTGNLYNIENIKYLSSLVSEKADLITADGGFDFSNDFNNQEKQSYRIIFCEIIAALLNQKIGGSFVCKIFDIYTLTTIKFMYLLSKYYEYIYITKPLTSRPANSEKYIICKNFKGVNISEITNLYYYLNNHTKINDRDFLKFIKVPNHFLIKIKEFNEIITKNQIKNIKNTLNIINITDEHIISTITKNQIVKALSWCNKYNIEINKESKYLKYE